jgi:hypothetical protein
MGQSDPSGNVPYRVLTDAARVAVFRSATRFSLCAGLPGQPPQRFRIPVTVLKGPANAGLLCLDQPLAKVRTATSLVERRLSPSPERPQPRLLSLLASTREDAHWEEGTCIRAAAYSPATWLSTGSRPDHRTATAKCLAIRPQSRPCASRKRIRLRRTLAPSGGVSPCHRGCACSARRSRASRTSWPRSAPAGRPR